MHATRTAPDQQTRLASREAQTRAWAAPLPDIGVLNRTPINGQDTAMLSNGLATNWLPRQRLEWETRDTMSNRIWTNMMEMAPQRVSTEMLATHPTEGANMNQPQAARTDERPYTAAQEVAYFPDSPEPLERPRLPAKNLFQNPWALGYDIEGGNITRELRATVKENNRFLTENTSLRIAGRTFEHQWVPAEATKAIANQKIEASELLRPGQDNFRETYLSSLKRS